MGRKGVTADVSHRKAERPNVPKSRWAPPVSSFPGDVAPDSDRSARIPSSAVPSSVLVKPPKRGRKPRKRIARRVHVKAKSTRRGQVIKADREWAEKVRERSPKLCEYCGRHFGSTPMTTPEAHHLYTKGSDPKLRHVLANGIHLHWFCHHVTAHSDMDGFRAWFSEAYPVRWAALERARLA